MADSQSLRIAFASASLHDQFVAYVSEYLRLQGFGTISPSILNFLCALDCGINYSAEIARRLKVSRQMVTKTVKELCRVGYLEQIEGVGQQKHILFTEQGERLISTARLALAALDQIFIESFGKSQVEEAALQLEAFKVLLMALQEKG
jgi:DNA-binding MarR family transcriptional regulator